ncbi:hypothetical protein MWH28_03995 [Natroniella sulfidigena]|uniref:MotE family protein n=1 Tax=Natroniella sulfidigena TaxID=723921 RepID=UPI00200A8B43|nr:hypothetical protein [Natroniella sulfidigena]MCK8816529.1 hypothetical protein [Natroniella sulfidigena]
MKTKILLALVILVILTGVTVFLLDMLEVYTFDQIRGDGIDLLSALPVVGDYLTAEEEIERLEEELAIANSELAEVEDQNQRLYFELEDSEEEVEQLNEMIDSLEEDLERVGVEREDYETRLNRLADIYSQMNSQRAADLLPDLDVGLATDILSQMDEEIVAEILEFMPNEEAAQYSTLLSE